jgi:hypothetical protein
VQVGLNFEQETKEANFRYSLVIAPIRVCPPDLDPTDAPRTNK